MMPLRVTVPIGSRPLARLNLPARQGGDAGTEPELNLNRHQAPPRAVGVRRQRRTVTTPVAMSVKPRAPDAIPAAASCLPKRRRRYRHVPSAMR